MKPGPGRTRLLAAMLVVGAIAAGPMLLTDPLIAARWHDVIAPSKREPAVRGIDTTVKEADDVPLGARLPVRLATLPAWKSAGNTRGYLIVGLGDCSGCIRMNLQAWEQDAHRAGVPIAAFTLSNVKDIDRFKREATVAMPMLTDVGNELHKALHCYFAGRVYYFDKTRRLAWQMHWQDANTSYYYLPALVAATHTGP